MLRFALATLLAVFALPAWAATYGFTFTEGSVLHADGEFTTGGPSSLLGGYFVVTGLTFTSIRDEQTGTLSTGSLTAESMTVGAAYNPSNGQFFNNFAGRTFLDIGSFDLLGSSTPTNFGGFTVLGKSFSVAGSENNFAIYKGSVFIDRDLLLTVTPTDAVAPVPLPAGGVLMGSALLGLLVLRRRA